MTSQNIQDREALYESLPDNILDGVAYCQMIFDGDGNPVDFLYLWVNKRFETLTGLKNSEGKRVTQLIPGIRTSNPELFDIYGRVSLTGVSESFEIYVKPLEEWFFANAYSIKKNFFVTVFQNISEKKLIKESLNNARIAAKNVLEDLQLEKRELAYAKVMDEAMLASIGDGVIAVDQAGMITLVNQPAQLLLGWKSAEIMHKVLFDVVPVEDERGEKVPLIDQPTAIALEIGTTTTTTTTTIEERKQHSASQVRTIKEIYYYVRKDKTKFPASVTVTPILLHKKIVGAIQVFHDITKERAVDKAKSEFVSLASHQLRSPVASIKWYTEMMLSGDAGPLNKQQKEFFGVIYQSNQRMADMVSALLNVSRLELGTFIMEPTLINSIELITEVMSEHIIAADQKGIVLKMTSATAIPLVLVDPKLLRMVMTNIFSNAIKYTPPKGHIECVVWTVKKGELVGGREMQEERLIIKVSDTGYGIPQGQQDKIFSKLFRADNVRAKDTDGTGLGLYIAKAIIDRSGGRIWFESKEDKGSTFFVELPLVVHGKGLS